MKHVVSEVSAPDPAQDQIERVRDKQRQLDMMGVPEANLDGHAFHTYRSAIVPLVQSSCQQ